VVVAAGGVGVARGGTDSLGALALLPCFFSVVKTSKMSCKNSSFSSSGVIASLTYKMCNSITSLIQLVEVLCELKYGGGSCTKMVQV
jgi:hypothetical protein